MVPEMTRREIASGRLSDTTRSWATKKTCYRQLKKNRRLVEEDQQLLALNDLTKLHGSGNQPEFVLAPEKKPILYCPTFHFLP